MIPDANMLCEIGTEEIPAGYIPPAIESIRKIFRESLKQNRLEFNEVEVYATPRRLVAAVSNLSGAQNEEVVEVKGPSRKAAFDSDGNPTKALEGFLKGNGVSRDDIEIRETDKGEYVFASKKLESRKTEEIIPGIIEEAVNTLSFPKRMRWSDKGVTFPRPISYFIILFNNELVPFEIDGIASGSVTRGHYIQDDRFLEVTGIDTYEELLEKNGVILDHRKRREMISDGLQKAAKEAGFTLNQDEELLDTVTFLVEQPHVVFCEFDSAFLEVPDIVLIAEMKEHQKYFSLLDEKGGLVNRFLVVSNNPPTGYIKEGNERVITARFNDARFFYDEDRKVKLIDRVESLKSVLFHKELGSIYDKIERMIKAAGLITKSLSLEKESGTVDRALLLCKTDLVTAMVNEFPSLQGKIGNIYALLDGEDEAVARAIDEHYRPRFHGDRLPEDMVSIIVSLCEKLDNIFGSFSVGNIPKGSADPYALRRQAGAVVELLIEREISLDLGGILTGMSGNYREGGSLVETIGEFIRARARTIFTDRGLQYDEIEACLSIGSGDYLELYRRARAVSDFRKDERFSQMLLGLKRMNNIVSAFRKENPGHALKFDKKKLEDDAEKELFAFFSDREKEIRKFIETSNYIDLFNLLIEARPVIDTFFDKVLVMDERTDVRDNRLYILESILGNFSSLIDFSKIADK